MSVASIEPIQTEFPASIVRPTEGVGAVPRGLARVIDLIIHNFAIVLASLIAGAILGVIASLSNSDAQTLTARVSQKSFLDTLAVLIGYVCYQGFTEWLGGASIGKLIFGDVVVKEDGSPCTMSAALIRNVLFYLDGLFLGLIGVLQMRNSALRQRLGDKAASTVVVQRKTLAESQRKSAGMILLGITAGLGIDMLVGALAVFLKAM